MQPTPTNPSTLACECLTFEPERIANWIAGLDRIVLDSTEPMAFLERAFNELGNSLYASSGSVWVPIPSGELVCVRHLSTELEHSSSTPIEPTTLQKHVREALLYQEAVLIPAGGADASPTQSCRLLVIPIRFEGEVKAVFAFSGLGEPNPTMIVSETVGVLQLSLELQLAATVEQLRRNRHQNPWSSQIAVPETEPVSSLSSSCSTPAEPPAPACDRITQNPKDVIALAEGIGKHSDPKLVAFDIVNELKAYFGLGRIGLIEYRHGRCQLMALSGVASFDRRSEAVIAIEHMAKMVARTGTPIWDSDPEAPLSESMRSVIDQYYQTTNARSVAMIPIFAIADPSTDPNNLADAISEGSRRDPKVLAIVSIEGLQDEIQREAIEDSWSEVERLVTHAVQNSAKLSNIFLRPLWTVLGDVRDLFLGHHRRKALACLAAAAMIAVTLAALPSPLKLRATGIIQPAERTRLYCEIPGIVRRIHTDDGQMVAKGAPLLELSSPDLDLEWERVQGELRESQESLATLRNHLNSNRALDEATVRSFRKERAALEARCNSLESQRNLLELKRQQLHIISPIDGRVVTWDIRRRLSQRPIEVGQHLLTIAQDQGKWELELRVPDHLTGYLRSAIANGEHGHEVPVEFVLASNPSETHRGRVRRIASVNTLTDDDGCVLFAYVDIDDTTRDWLSSVRPGTEVIAHLHAGNRCLGTALFFEFFDWIQRTRFRYLG